MGAYVTIMIDEQLYEVERELGEDFRSARDEYHELRDEVKRRGKKTSFI